MGEAVHAYLGHLSDAAIDAMLNELATESLGQERVYVAFAERTWILDAVAPARGHAGGPTAPAKIARVEAARIAYEAAKARCRGGPVLEAPSEA
jgi:hypothetical protein